MSLVNLNLIAEAPHCYLTYIPPATEGAIITYKMHVAFQIPAQWEYYSCNVDAPVQENTNSPCGGAGTKDTFQLIHITLKEKLSEPTCTGYKTFNNLFPGIQQDNCHHKIIVQIEFLQENGQKDPSDRKTIIRTIDADANGG